MKTFHCDVCGSLVFFENVSCVHCGHALGFLPDVLDLSAVELESAKIQRALAPAAGGRRYRVCANGQQHSVCNWLVPEEEPDAFCASCRLNDVIPDLSVTGNQARWHRLELAKRRLVYTLLKLGLPTDRVPSENRPSLRFRFLGETRGQPGPLTGHEDGLITINITEADDDVREQRRVSLLEPLRTLLGHFRHEVAHYYWDRLIADSPWLDRFRQLFGNERADYGAALQRHYRHGPPIDWVERSVSAYASVHPWEDWAETMAHYFHIIDSLETAGGFGMSLRPKHPSARMMTADARKIAESHPGFEQLLATWFPLTYALNSLNRGMGLPDLYPFVLSEIAVSKLRFVHEVIEEAQRTSVHRHSYGDEAQQVPSPA
ncbi:MAG: putative zinc-binding metallopeptidase [Opitutus sp.]